MKKAASSLKIKYFILSIIFTVAFLSMALCIGKSVSVYAYILGSDESSEIFFNSDNISAVNGVGNYRSLDTNDVESATVNGTTETTGDTAGYLYWAASGNRSGVVIYTVNGKGKAVGNGIILMADKQYYSKATFINYAGAYGVVSNPTVLKVPNINTVYYSSGWKSNGSYAISWLMDDSGVPVYNIKDAPNWLFYLWKFGGLTENQLKKAIDPDTKWQIVIEPFSVNMLYTGSTFSSDGSYTGPDNIEVTYKKGDPSPVGGSSPTVFAFTSKRYGIYLSNVGCNAGAYTYKFYNKALPWSLCLEEGTTIGGTSVSTPSGSSSSGEGSASSVASASNGLGVAVIDVTGVATPLHTYNGVSSPGDPEEPVPDVTDGKKNVYKYYYTEYLDKDGKVISGKADADGKSYSKELTTSYISIDNESSGGYTIEKWSTSKETGKMSNLSSYTSKANGSLSGTGAEEIVIPDGESSLYVVYKKTIQEEEDPDPDYNYIISQCQVTRKVKLSEADQGDLSISSYAVTWKADSVRHSLYFFAFF